MSLIDFSKDDLSISLQIHHLKQTLHHCAHLSLLCDTTDKDQLAKTSSQLLFDLLIDPISGGMYVRNNQEFHLNALHNIQLADYLLAADRVFYQGDLAYCALNLLTCLHTELYDPQRQLFYNGLSYQDPNVPFNVSRKNLENWLDEAELKLLLALLKVTEPSQVYTLNYRTSLSQAALVADCHLKLAQVQQASIQQKIKHFRTPEYSKKWLSSEQDIVINANILTVYVQAIVWNNADNFVPLVDVLYQTLKSKLLSEYPSWQTTKIISVINSLCHYQQINLQHETLKQLITIVTQLDIQSCETWEPLKHFQWQNVIAVLKYFDDIEQLKKICAQYQTKYSTLDSVASVGCEVVILLDNSTGVAQRQTLKARYHSGLMIFTDKIK